MGRRSKWELNIWPSGRKSRHEQKRQERLMAGKINRQVKSREAILVNGRWVHQYLDNRPPSPALLRRLEEIGRRLQLRSL